LANPMVSSAVRLLTLTFLGFLAKAKEGVKMSADITVFEEFNHVYYEEVLSFINNIPLPDINLKHGYYLKDNTFTVTQSKFMADMSLNGKKNAFEYSTARMSAIIECHNLHYVYHGLILNGHAGLKLMDIALEFGVKAEMTTLEDGRQVPYYQVIDVKTHITRKNVNLILGGGFLLDMADIIKGLFRADIAKHLTEAVTKLLEDELPKALNYIPQKTQMYIPVPGIDNWMIDAEISSPAIITDRTM